MHCALAITGGHFLGVEKSENYCWSLKCVCIAYVTVIALLLIIDSSTSFLLVDISSSFGENLYANVSFLCNRKFDLVSQSGWITLHATISCELDFRFARSCAAIALPGVCT